MSRAKHAMLSEQYYDLSEEEMQEIISRSQAGDSTASMELLEIFDNFLTKYATLLYYNKYSLGDYDIRQFISLLIPDPTIRKYLGRNKLNVEGRRRVHDVMSSIQYMVRRYGDETDIRQTVDLTFLQCVDHYERKKSKRGGWVPFSGYLYSYYYFVLKKNVEALLIDQLGLKTFPLISDEESNEDWDSDDRSPGFTAPPEPGIEDLLHADVIDERWVAGDTAYHPFDVLTIQERQLIKWRFVNGDKSSDIANKITEHPNTVREHFNRVRGKLRKAIEEDVETW